MPSIADIINNAIHDIPEITMTAGMVGAYTLLSLSQGHVPNLYEVAGVSYVSNLISDPLVELLHPMLVAAPDARGTAANNYFSKFGDGKFFGTLVTEGVLEAGLGAALTFGVLASGLPVVSKIYEAGSNLYSNIPANIMEGAATGAEYTAGLFGIVLASYFIAEVGASFAIAGLSKGLKMIGDAGQKLSGYWHRNKYGG